MNFYEKNIETIYKELNTSYNGLSEKNIALLNKKYGKNILQERKKKTKIRRFIEQFSDMMIIILLIVAVIMFIYGLFYSHDYTDSIVILVVVLINAIMGFVQENKAEVTLDSLKRFCNIMCKVKRNGSIKVIKQEELVPGDIIILNPGDLIPADARIIESSNFCVDESPLTGESLPVNKDNKILKNISSIQEQKNMVFSGCSVTNGYAIAVVTAIGMMTELGHIAFELDTPYEVKTPLEIKIEEISKKLTILIFTILIFVFIYGLFSGYKLLEIIMLCVTLAVAAIPEGLPAVITIALSIGTANLAKKKAVIRQMSAIETLGSTDVICSDKTGTITKNKMTVVDEYFYNTEFVKYIMALCNDTIIDEKKKYIGDPTEICLYDYLLKKNINIDKILNKYKRINDIPFDSERKIMSTINKIDGKYYILVKGSIDTLLDKCKYIGEQNKKITKKQKEEINNIANKYAKNALRVISFAYRELKNTELENCDNCENDLIFAGLVGIIDPPRDNVYRSVQKCHLAGIKPIMITGDSLVTASAIAREVGILENNNEAVLGSDLDKYTDEELIDLVPNISVYARVNPKHKQRIVLAWQKRGCVVAMTGDGVNDAPAIKDAHVGIGMGITGTEVTKSVADVILLDDSFSTIVVAVEEGRRIFSNIRNNIVYSLSSNFAEIFAVIIGMIAGSSILLPIHILFIDLVTDSIPSICLSFEKSEKRIMKNKPRGINKPIFTPFINATIIGSAIIETLFVIGTYFLSYKLMGSNAASSMALLSMVMQEILFSISCRNLKQPISEQGFFSNSIFNIGLLCLIAIESLVFLTPVGSIINVEFVGIYNVTYIVLINLLAFLLYEGMKIITKRYFND